MGLSSSEIPDTGAIAAVFAILFFACCIWLWRCSSRIAALVLALQFAVEATQAHTWKGASPTAKEAGLALGTAGLVAATVFVAQSLPPSPHRPRNHWRS